MRHLVLIKRLPHMMKYMGHMLIHVLIGLVYAWVLRETWYELDKFYILLAVLGSVIIDFDHILFFLTYGRNETYAKEVRKLFKQGQIKTMIKFQSNNHKHNTGLITHNIYFVGFFLIMSLISFNHDWKARAIIFGAIVLHLLFDILDDLWTLGNLNPNWKRLRRIKGGGNPASFLGDPSFAHQTSKEVKRKSRS